MNKLFKIIIPIFIPFIVLGQEKDFYDLDNSYYELYSKSKVKFLKVFTKEYDNGELNEEYLELVQDFDKNGDIIREREYYDSYSTNGWEVFYSYNNFHQTIRTEWTWIDEKDKELTEYEYDSDNKLIKSCDYYKSSNDSEFKLEECLKYYYKKNIIWKVTTLNNQLKTYYKKIGRITLGYSTENKLKYKYKNGEFIYQNMDSIIFQYKRNIIGQIIETTKTDDKENLISKSVYEYSNGLLKKIVSKDNDGNLIRKKDYIYEYYK